MIRESDRYEEFLGVKVIFFCCCLNRTFLFHSGGKMDDFADEAIGVETVKVWKGYPKAEDEDDDDSSGNPSREVEGDQVGEEPAINAVFGVESPVAVELTRG
jgi:hypothetical protein